MTDNLTIVISKEEYEELLERSAFLACLEAVGVSSWPGYELAKDMDSEFKEL